jgi:toxin ParE1/3/4
LKRVWLSPRADRDIEDIGDYIAADSPARAVTFVAELRMRCLSLADVAEGYPPIRPGHAWRRALYGRYLILFTIDDGAVRIERVLHGARDVDALL